MTTYRLRCTDGIARLARDIRPCRLYIVLSPSSFLSHVPSISSTCFHEADLASFLASPLFSPFSPILSPTSPSRSPASSRTRCVNAGRS